MKAPIFVRTLTADEQDRLRAGLRSKEAFTARRCQILLASAGGATPGQIARQLHCASATARNAIHAFAREGLAALREKSHKPHSLQAALGPGDLDLLKELLHRSPRTLGKATGLWTLDLLAEVCHAQGWTPRVLTKEGMRLTLKRLGIGWKRAKHWITSPDPAYARKKARDRLIRLAAAHPAWVLGFQDECWWSRLAQPARHAWTPDEPLHLIEEAADKTDPDPKALACYGLLRYDTGEMLLRFVRGRPVSQVTEEYLAWVCAELAAEGKKALLLVWDNASWHNSQRVRAWIKAHNRRVKRAGGVRIIVCYLPSKSPWLNAIEPKWVHGKRAIAEADRKLTAAEVKSRACDYYGCELLEPLEQKVA